MAIFKGILLILSCIIGGAAFGQDLSAFGLPAVTSVEELKWRDHVFALSSNFNTYDSTYCLAISCSWHDSLYPNNYCFVDITTSTRDATNPTKSGPDSSCTIP